MKLIETINKARFDNAIAKIEQKKSLIRSLRPFYVSHAEFEKEIMMSLTYTGFISRKRTLVINKKDQKHVFDFSYHETGKKTIHIRLVTHSHLESVAWMARAVGITLKNSVPKINHLFVINTNTDIFSNKAIEILDSLHIKYVLVNFNDERAVSKVITETIKLI